MAKPKITQELSRDKFVSLFPKVGNNQDDSLSGKSCDFFFGRAEKTCKNVLVGCSISGPVTQEGLAEEMLMEGLVWQL